MKNVSDDGRFPFRALRFDPGSDGTWGINFSRNLRRNNELSYWAPIPRSFTLNRLSLAGEIDGLPTVSAGRDLRITPYALGGTVRHRPGAGSGHRRHGHARRWPRRRIGRRLRGSARAQERSERIRYRRHRHVAPVGFGQRRFQPRLRARLLHSLPEQHRLEHLRAKDRLHGQGRRGIRLAHVVQQGGQLQPRQAGSDGARRGLPGRHRFLPPGRCAQVLHRHRRPYWELSANPTFERIDEEFVIDPEVDPIPPGSYGWTTWMFRGETDPSRAVSGSFTGTAGGLWSGTQKTVNASVTVRPSFRFRATLSGQHTNAELEVPAGKFTKTFWTTRANYSFSRNMFVDALLQYDPESTLFNANVRFNFIHHPLSDLFVVYNEQRFATDMFIRPGRSLTIKLTQMVAF